jgi:hypothetical protein
VHHSVAAKTLVKKNSPFTKRTAKVGSFKIISKTFFVISDRKGQLINKLYAVKFLLQFFHIST